ncbi:MAG: pyrroloquinoline quinone biosynthesis peptide chaperone PqqD [Pseudomonadota bacterium]
MTAAIAIEDGSVPHLPRGVKLRFDKQRDNWVVLAPERVFVPDPIALEIIKRCDGEASVREIVDDLAKTFNAERALIDRDVKAMLQDLADKGVMRA